MIAPPGYWMHETGGVLRPAIIAYLNDRPMTPEQIAAMRAYLRQWVADLRWRGAGLDMLRETVDRLTTKESIDEWLIHAEYEGIDPL